LENSVINWKITEDIINWERVEFLLSQNKIAKVTKPYNKIYHDPIIIKQGEEVEVSDKQDNWNGFIWVWCTNQAGKSGWVAPEFLEIEGSKGIAKRDYSAMELNASIGDEMVVVENANGWLWCINESGESGWIPAENVEMKE
jgi:hypothetical protein